MKPAISARNLSKCYKLGVINRQTLVDEVRYWLSKVRRRDPREHFTKIGHTATEARRIEAENAGEDSFWALKDVSFDVQPGEVVGIIGRNGAGKSTLLKILTKITEPTSGEAIINGRIGSLLEVGTGFHPELTGRENIYMNGTILGMKKHEVDKKFDEIVAFSEFGKFIDTPVKRYSSGMLVRLAFAVAAHLDPEILIVDEVLAVGDIEFQKKCIGKMENIKDSGRTVLIVSHNMFNLENLCNKGILLESGKKAMEGDIDSVISHYLTGLSITKGEVNWTTPTKAPGNHKVRLKALRIVSENVVTGKIDISKESRIEVDYWNLVENERRLVSIQLINSKSILVFSSTNLPSIASKTDFWCSRELPKGIFRSSCTVPANFLNDGKYAICVFIVGETFREKMVRERNLLFFIAKDKNVLQREFAGRWGGIVRPHLEWRTTKLDEALIKSCP